MILRKLFPPFPTPLNKTLWLLLPWLTYLCPTLSLFLKSTRLFSWVNISKISKLLRNVPFFAFQLFVINICSIFTHIQAYIGGLCKSDIVGLSYISKCIHIVYVCRLHSDCFSSVCMGICFIIFNSFYWRTQTICFFIKWKSIWYLILSWRIAWFDWRRLHVEQKYLGYRHKRQTIRIIGYILCLVFRAQHDDFNGWIIIFNCIFAAIVIVDCFTALIITI